MKNQILILAITFFVAILSAQEKGTTPLQLPTANRQLQTSSYAVVIGISDYQDPGIPDLRFADKDAEAFANYLRSSAGGNLDNDHLKVLINEQATMAQFANALDWLWENAKEGDHAIIYFSGHGDVEKKSLTQPGFLLCWDAPARVYMAGGAFALPMLQEVISTLSTVNKAKVIVITDACHSGKLSGNEIYGAQLTGQNLARQYANEIKLLSCQPNEYSIEGEQWGGGRGAFSFHLIDALYGLADHNGDQFITLQEAGRYLEDHVSNEVAPVSQVPMFIGNRNEKLTTVDQSLLASIKSGKTNQMAILTPIESRGIEDEILKGVDTSIRKRYQLFKEALAHKVFLEPVNACAESYYTQLIAEPKIQRLHSAMKRNYAAALQDDAQQVMNKWLNVDIKEIYLSKKTRIEKYKVYPRYLQKAAELLGSNHYMYRTLQARKHLFEGNLIALSNINTNKEVGEKALKEYRTALEWEPELPHVYWLMSRVYAFNLNQADSSEYYGQQAAYMLPSWLLPYESLAYIFSQKFGQPERMKFYLQQANLIDSNASVVKEMWGRYFLNKFQFDKAEKYLLKALEADSTNIYAIVILAVAYRELTKFDLAEKYAMKAIQFDSTYVGARMCLGNVHASWGNYPEAVLQFIKALQMDSLDLDARLVLGNVYVIMKRYPEAEQEFNNIIKIDSTYELVWDRLASLYVNTQRVKEGVQIYLGLIEKKPNDKIYHYNLACVYSKISEIDKGYEYLENALKIGMSEYAEWLPQDPDLANLRQRTEQWDGLMKKYFPDKTK
jgi:Tfp pilus assembly protein PilF